MRDLLNGTYNISVKFGLLLYAKIKIMMLHKFDNERNFEFTLGKFRRYPINNEEPK